MREVQAPELASYLAEHLDTKRQGVTFVTTRHGRHVAWLFPEISQRQAAIDLAIHRIAALLQRTARWPLAEILSANSEGRD